MRRIERPAIEKRARRRTAPQQPGREHGRLPALLAVLPQQNRPQHGVGTTLDGDAIVHVGAGRPVIHLGKKRKHLNLARLPCEKTRPERRRENAAHPHIAYLPERRHDIGIGGRQHAGKLLVDERREPCARGGCRRQQHAMLQALQPCGHVGRGAVQRARHLTRRHGDHVARTRPFRVRRHDEPDRWTLLLGVRRGTRHLG